MATILSLTSATWRKYRKSVEKGWVTFVRDVYFIFQDFEWTWTRTWRSHGDRCWYCNIAVDDFYERKTIEIYKSWMCDRVDVITIQDHINSTYMIHVSPPFSFYAAFARADTFHLVWNMRRIWFAMQKRKFILSHYVSYHHLRLYCNLPLCEEKKEQKSQIALVSAQAHNVRECFKMEYI